MGNASARSTKINETEIDGVRCFWVDTGRPTLAASLMFRQGLADESLVESGWLHILEHMSLHGTGGGSLHVNGSVSMLVTSFDAHGPADAVASHFTSLTSALSAPDLRDLERERGVLRAEAQMRGGPVQRAVAWRYGARGPGTSSFAEPGLARATETALAARAAKVFVKQNAAIILDGPPPAGLQLSLPDGLFSTPAVAIPCEDELPAAYVDDVGVVLSGLVERSMGATVLPYVIERVLRERLRVEAGAAYAPWSVYERVDNGKALVIAGSDVNQEMYPDIVKATMTSLSRIDDEGFPAEYVREIVDAMLQAMRDPYNAFSFAATAANAFFDGRDWQDMDAILDEVSAVSSETLQQDWRSFRQSMLLGVPGKASWDDELTMLRAPSHPTRKEGRRFRHRDWPATTYELRIDDAAVQISENGEARSIQLDDVEAVISFSDGARNIISSDGWNIFIEGAEWTDGDLAMALLDRKIPLKRHLIQPARSGLDLGKRIPAAKRWWAGLKRVIIGSGVSVVVLYAFFIAIVVGACILVGNALPAIGGAVALWGTGRDSKA
jgi:hypothetical protein